MQRAATTLTALGVVCFDDIAGVPPNGTAVVAAAAPDLAGRPRPLPASEPTKTAAFCAGSGSRSRGFTGGAYCGVDADEDDRGAPFPVALEAGAARPKRAAQLSEGTRDQLFLALRLVMLEDYAQRAPAPPSIADDLLQTFNNYGRTAKALAALADLSPHVQVIVLSHHRRAADAARGLPEGVVAICDLAA